MVIDIADKSVITIGDIHGNFSKLRYEISKRIENFDIKNSIFIVLGDCGFFGEKFDYQWYSKKVPRLGELIALGKILKESENELYLFRGNHDNPSLFTKKYITKGKTDKIKVLKDYDVLKSTVYGNILIIPGAFSIDRTARTPGLDWWYDEGIKRLSVKKLNNIKEKHGTIDIILSHSTPHNPKPLPSNFRDYYEPSYDYIYGKGEFQKEMDIQEEYLIRVNEIMKPTKWISGHYHYHLEYTVPIDDKNNCKFTLIDIFEFYSL
jgi:hypothetical protein